MPTERFNDAQSEESRPEGAEQSCDWGPLCQNRQRSKSCAGWPAGMISDPLSPILCPIPCSATAAPDPTSFDKALWPRNCTVKGGLGAFYSRHKIRPEIEDLSASSMTYILWLSKAC
jgi:hypothetical protein